MSSLKIIYCDRNFPPVVGGSSFAYESLCRCLPSGAVTAVTGQHPDSPAFDHSVQYRIVRVPLPQPQKRFPGSGLWWLYRDNRALFEGICQVWDKVEPTVIQIGPMTASQYLISLCQRHLRCPVLVHVGPENVVPRKGGLVDNLLWHWLWRELRKADHLIPFSSAAEHILLAGGIPSNKITRIPPCFDLKPFMGAAGSGDLIRHRYGLHDSPYSPLVLSVGRLVPMKGHKLMIRIWPEILKVFPSAQYVIIGRGPLENGLRDEISSMGLEKSIHILTDVENDELCAWYDACNVFVNPNRYIPETGAMEGFGGVFLEAAVAGKPVIGGKTGGTADAVCDGVNGYLIDVEDRSALTGCLIQLLQEPERARAMGEAGRKWVLQTFNPNEIAARNLELCKRVYAECC